MTPEPRYVFDTSTLVSAVLFENSIPAQAFKLARNRGRILTSQECFKELQEVLVRSKFDRYVIREIRDRFLTLFLHEANLVEITEEIQVCRDPKDDPLLELCVSGGATCLISSDQDLLTLHPFREIAIFSPAQFLIEATPKREEPSP